MDVERVRANIRHILEGRYTLFADGVVTQTDAVNAWCELVSDDDQHWSYTEDDNTLHVTFRLDPAPGTVTINVVKVADQWQAVV